MANTALRPVMAQSPLFINRLPSEVLPVFNYLSSSYEKVVHCASANLRNEL